MIEKNYLIERFINCLKTNDRSTATIKNYSLDLYLFAKWFQERNREELMANKITPTDLRKYKEYLICYPMKPNSINRKIVVLKSFVNWLFETNRIKQRFPLPKMVKKTNSTVKWLNKNQQNFLLRHLEKYAHSRDYAIIKLLLNTGLRVNEIVKLKWIDVRITDKKGVLTVRYSKANRYRDVPLNKDARNALSTLGSESRDDKEQMIVSGQRGKLTARGIQLIIKRRFKHTELDFLSPHILRHTFCKNLVDAAVSLEKIALLAGHESLDTTRLYCQPSLDDLSDSINKISEEE